MQIGHGPNIGHGYVKYVAIGADGIEIDPIIFPAMIAPARKAVAGAIASATSVEVSGRRYWVGDDAALSASPLTFLAQDRLRDVTFIPTLLRGALARLNGCHGVAGSGVCVTGLPSTWATDSDLARLLGERMRAATAAYGRIRVIPEPLGLIYCVLLDNDGQITGDPVLQSGRIAVVDLGHLTVDIAEVLRLVPIPAALDTLQLGTAQPLKIIRGRLSAHFGRELTLHEADLAVRNGHLRVAGDDRPLPPQWDRPLIENGQSIVSRLHEAWGSGHQFDAIVIGGGGARLPQLTSAITARFRHAQVVPDPQLAIARGYARLARRLARGAQ